MREENEADGLEDQEMTVQETIKQLKCDMELITFNPNNGEVIPVECLNDLNRATYEADKMAISALEKQIPKKPSYEGDGYADGKMVYDTWICPCCATRYEVDYDEYDYCPECGQRIDWSEI